jgi:hypothetical protein
VAVSDSTVLGGESASNDGGSAHGEIDVFSEPVGTRSSTFDPADTFAG